MFENLIGCFSRRYFTWGLGTIGVFYVLGKALEEFKPVLVGITKESISFGQWLNASIEAKKEVMEDIVHEAKSELKKEIELKITLLQKQQELLEKLKSSL
ncbi:MULTISPECIES: hypothetical protein [unclassified Hydrogenobaculum]|uniref:hypothetical protein n=1 Tax=unclassified Hydrogenobaculum TaxID=2622382 RepID=UPI0001C502D2|nr:MULTISPECIES: hypothetical protein [unclassified Hydrogenobaculum]AEF19101.1 hypothetical protein Hyd3684_0706 [Hydrogenobaculum sp. 3684]AEG46391.1 hypothetical protein HydSHO_0707 [Hydrogenobaculum sp. SHO]AGG15034.1 hypothetical protein HydHO_0710 [Hydrogenobaculum sp. HO]AGH93331.1 hypothetical protein HydSN_0726 [Hydrogenobaculum sp. SN]